MAKAARATEPEISERMTNKFVADIFERMDNIESARGKYMNAARREREAMTTIYEGLAARGVSQKASKTEIKIITALEKIKGWMADLELEDRKMVERLAKVQGDKRQLSLFADLPKPTKAEEREAAAKKKAERDVGPTQPDLETAEAAGAA